MIITLLSDFGYQDNFVGLAKGILLRHLPHAQLVDLTHEVEPHHLLQCSYLFRGVYTAFPEKTVHLSLFDILHQVPATLLLCRANGQYIISADNGLLPLTFPEMSHKVYALPGEATSYMEWLHAAAGAIAGLLQDDPDLDQLAEAKPRVRPLQLRAAIKDDVIECQVIYIDRFGNVVLNLTQEEFETVRAGRRFEIVFMRNEIISQISNHYTDVAQGEKLCLFNNTGFMEIAINRGKASTLLGLSLPAERQLVYQQIKIQFF
jgi:S-adenosylmethionine hydrolase